jgi:hypothetical protein
MVDNLPIVYPPDVPEVTGLRENASISGIFGISVAGAGTRRGAAAPNHSRYNRST